MSAVLVTIRWIVGHSAFHRVASHSLSTFERWRHATASCAFLSANPPPFPPPASRIALNSCVLPEHTKLDSKCKILRRAKVGEASREDRSSCRPSSPVRLRAYCGSRRRRCNNKAFNRTRPRSDGPEPHEIHLRVYAFVKDQQAEPVFCLILFLTQLYNLIHQLHDHPLSCIWRTQHACSFI
jgi:hypothetical protein